MKVRFVLVFAVALLLGGMAIAQEVTGDYSYFRFNPGLSKYFNSHSLTGGGGQVTFFITPNIGLAGDLRGYGSYTQCTKPSAIIQGCASGNLFTYMFGSQLKARIGKLEAFPEVLLGGAHSNFYGNACSRLTVYARRSRPATMRFLSLWAAASISQ